MKDYFTFQGRLSRLPFFQKTVRLYLVLLVLLAITVTATMEFGRIAAPLNAIPFGVGAWGNLSLTARRLSDLGFAKAWAVPLLLLIVLGPIGVEADGGRGDISILALVAVFAALAAQLWLYFAKGKSAKPATGTKDN